MKRMTGKNSKCLAEVLFLKYRFPDRIHFSGYPRLELLQRSVIRYRWLNNFYFDTRLKNMLFKFANITNLYFSNSLINLQRTPVTLSKTSDGIFYGVTKHLPDIEQINTVNNKKIFRNIKRNEAMRIGGAYSLFGGATGIYHINSPGSASILIKGTGYYHPDLTAGRKKGLRSNYSEWADKKIKRYTDYVSVSETDVLKITVRNNNSENMSSPESIQPSDAIGSINCRQGLNYAVKTDGFGSHYPYKELKIQYVSQFRDNREVQKEDIKVYTGRLPDAATDFTATKPQTDISYIVSKVYSELERKIRLEKERIGR